MERLALLPLILLSKQERTSSTGFRSPAIALLARFIYVCRQHQQPFRRIVVRNAEIPLQVFIITPLSG
jgi:hypothetical protein